MTGRIPDRRRSLTAILACAFATIEPGPHGGAAASPSLEMIEVPAGSFTMGRRLDGDDAAYGGDNEIPQHEVTLSGYNIGRFEVTNQQYCDVLNWANDRGVLVDASGSPWAGAGDLYAGGHRQLIVLLTNFYCNVEYLEGEFRPKSRSGMPASTMYSMASHPMVQVSWYGAAAYCNWLSEIEGLPPCYDMEAPNWPLLFPPPGPGGYRLPTEAEWERASGWDTSNSAHWTYGFTADVLNDRDRCNYQWFDGAEYVYINPMGLSSPPYTTPVGWFNGANISPNGAIPTLPAVSPAGCYDMSGNVWEWVQDWSYREYSAGEEVTDPAGPESGSHRAIRGGTWNTPASFCRSANRNSRRPPEYTGWGIGFRASRSCGGGCGDAPPEATITPTRSSPTVADIIGFQIVFNESVGTSVNGASVGLSPGSLPGSIDVAGAGTEFLVTVTMSDPEADGVVAIVLDGGGAIMDSEGTPFGGLSSPAYTIFNWKGFSLEPADSYHYSGEGVVLEVGADFGPIAPIFQWKRAVAGKAVESGPAAPQWSVTELSPADAGEYWCEITYDAAPHSSRHALLYVADPLTIIAHPVGGAHEAGAEHTFAAAVQGGHPPLQFRWLKNNEPLTGAPYATELTIVNLRTEDSGQYRLVVTDASGRGVTSQEAGLTVVGELPVAANLGQIAAVLLVCAIGLYILSPRGRRVARRLE